VTTTTDPRPPRVDPPVGPTPTTCTIPDPYWYPVLCDQVEPCSADGVTTLWGSIECGPHNPTLAEFCSIYASHPACPPVVVEVGTPPTLPPADLPATGATGGALAFGLYFLVVGTIAVIGTRGGR